MSEGRYFVDAVSVSAFNPIGSTTGIIAGMDKTRSLICDTRLRHSLSENITNPTVREFGFVDTGSSQTGQARVSGSTGVDTHFKILQGPSPLRIRKTTDGVFTANLTYIGWEIDSVV